MPVLAQVNSLFRNFFRKPRIEKDLDEEIGSHLELLTDQKIREGMSPRDARRAARIELGGVEQVKEHVRAVRAGVWLESLWQDVSFGVRMLRKNPGFTAVAILTLGLGIGANTAIFSVVHDVLLKPLPYKNPGNLIEVWNTYLPTWPQIGLSGADFENLRHQAHSLSEMAGYRFVGQDFNVTSEAEPDRLEAAYATSNLFPLLGVRPIVGRTFGPEEDELATAPVVVISHRVWQSRFSSNPSIGGRILNLDGKGYTLIGVLPASFHLVPWADLWLPIGQMDPEELTGRVFHPFGVIARLRPGVGISQTQAELSTLANRAAMAFPATNQNFGLMARRLEDASAANMRRALLLLFASVGLVLLIACVNVVNLLLSRYSFRRKEIALRAAVGASQSRLVRQLLTESVLLSFVGGALGLFLAIVGLGMLRPLLPSDLANVVDVRLNIWVLGFAVLVCLLAGMACGVGPALQHLKTAPNHFVSEGDRGPSPSGAHQLQRSLVVCEIALALVLMIGAGLLLRSLDRLLAVDPGFRPDHLFAMQVPQATIPASTLRQMSTDQRQQLFRKQSLQFEQIADRLKKLPGVERVGGIDVLPLSSSTFRSSRFVIEGQPIPTAAARPSAEVRTISVDYFSTIGIPLIKGRLFNEDDWNSPRVVINETMALRFWPGGDPINRRINLCSLAPQPCWSSIIGVVGDLHQFGLDASPTFDVYATGGWTSYFVVRTVSDSLGLAAEAEQEVHKIDAGLPVVRVTTMDALLAESVSPRCFSTLLLGILAILGLLLSAVGIYGVMAYTITQRTHEIGIRMALGARSKAVLGLVIGEGLRLVALGVVVGLLGAFGVTRLLAGLLYGISPSDPLTYAIVALALASVALLACYIPARRATKVDPMVALRYE